MRYLLLVLNIKIHLHFDNILFIQKNKQCDHIYFERLNDKHALYIKMESNQYLVMKDRPFINTYRSVQFYLALFGLLASSFYAFFDRIYRFYLAADSTGELWLSSDESEANVVKIVTLNGWTEHNRWLK